MSLNANSISAEQVESSSKTILAEWLSRWFTGQSQVLSGKEIQFPLAEVEFDQGPSQSPPSSKTLIRVRAVSLWDESMDSEQGRVKHDHVRMIFVAKASGEKARERSQKVGELLHWLLNNPSATVDLAEKGIFDIDPMKAEPLASTDHYQYMVQAKMCLQYEVVFRT
ncbi:MAG TPA: hypothetical protein VGH19_06720 [Verrucomicrobiae bacterium]